MTIWQLVWLSFCGCSLIVTGTEQGGFMFFVLLCPGAPEGSISSGSGLKRLRSRDKATF